MDIPVIDIAPFFSGDDDARAGVSAQWDVAMRAFGFATISGHGVAESLLADVHQKATAFFARPLDDKMTLCFGDMLRGQGYLPLGNETVGKARDAKSRPDLCESLSFSATPGARDNLWPGAMPDFRPAIETYLAAAGALARCLMQLSAHALKLPDNYFAPYFDRMNSDLRCVLYPDQKTPPQEGQLRYGPHTDFGGFTILRQDSAPGGLQVETQAGWIDVRPIPGTLVVNAGDLIQRWTNDRWISNVHRVANPCMDPPPLRARERAGGGGARSTLSSVRRAEGVSTKRLSIVLFTSPNSDAVIETLPGCGAPRYAPIVAGAHVEERIAQTYGNLARENS